MAKILLFQCEQEKEIRQIVTPMKIAVVQVPPQFFHLTLGELEKGKFSDFPNGGKEEKETGSGTGKRERAYPADSLMVMCGVTEKQMNRLLMELRRKEIRVAFKAVLTATNREWNVGQMYLEMARERAMYAEMRKRSGKE